ncbi:MAG: hypothetical protein IPK18_09635 [Sphingobacteriales bacterium]|nr:MAG: hypothetical protein IPK18_09635 [Sphingobacteriales bacterium]
MQQLQGATNTSMLAADKTVNSTTYPNDAYPDEYDWHDIYAEKYITNTVNLVPRTITKYFVFRKYKGPNEYLYCWIRIGSKSVVKSYTDQSTNTVKKYMSLETTCYEGKQQLNSIVTGK